MFLDRLGACHVVMQCHLMRVALGWGFSSCALFFVLRYSYLSVFICGIKSNEKKPPSFSIQHVEYMLAFKAVLSCLRMITTMLLTSECTFTHQKNLKILPILFSPIIRCVKGTEYGVFHVRSLSIWESATGEILCAFLLLRFYKQALTEAGYMFQLCSYLFWKTSAIRYSFFVCLFFLLILAIGEKA